MTQSVLVHLFAPTVKLRTALSHFDIELVAKVVHDPIA